MNIEKTIRNLELRGFGVKHFATGAEASSYLAGSISGTTVGIGGSKTVDTLGLYDLLCENNTVYWHWKTPSAETRAAANAAPVYLCSVNALSEDGELLNIDGNGNRLCATSYGTKKVYFVVGTNKIEPDFMSALNRARNVAARKNAERFGKKTPCTMDGKCHDCRSSERICKGLLVLWAPMTGMDVEVVLIDEELGF